MAKKKEKTSDNNPIPGGNAEAAPLKDEDLFEGAPPSVESKPDSLFDLAGVKQPAAVQAAQPVMSLRFMQMTLGVCILLTVIVVCFLFFSRSGIDKQIIVSSLPQTQPQPVQPAQVAGQPSDTNSEEEPASLNVAVQYYKKQDYTKAAEVFKKLQSRLLPTGSDSFNDYLLLCSALCDLKTANTEQAINALKTASQSESNFIRLCANYYLCHTRLSNNQFDLVPGRAYQVLAMIDSVAADEKIAAVRSDCEYFAAIAQTRLLTGLSDTDRDVPPDLYQKTSTAYDVILDVDETKLKQILLDQQYKFQAGVLSPAIERCKPADSNAVEQLPVNLMNCSVITYDSSIEELLSRFASSFSLELSWDIKNDLQTIRQKPVRLYMNQCTVEEFLQTAAGAAGLAAEITGNTVKIYNPSDYTVLSERLDMLYGQTVRLWQKFMISHFQDERICNAHFAVATLYAGKNNIPQAIDEFKLISSKYSQSKVAPYALLQAARLKIGLNDLTDARSDLKELVEQYSDCPIADKAYIMLADITSTLGGESEAAKMFVKVYNLNYSAQSQRVAAISAAQAFYKTGNYESAIQWATKYINITKDADKNSLCRTYLLVGKIYLASGKLDKAGAALRFAIEGELAREEYKNAVLSLIDCRIKQRNYIDALNVLANIDSWQFSEPEFMQLLVTKSRIYRDMGLYSKAISALADKAEYVSDKQLKSQMFYEIALCKIASGEPGSAYTTLTDTIAICEPGELNDQITAALADVCLKLNRDKQAYDLCTGLIDNSSSKEIKLQARQIIAEVYRRQNNFDKAALALLGEAKKNETK